MFPGVSLQTRAVFVWLRRAAATNQTNSTLYNLTHRAVEKDREE